MLGKSIPPGTGVPVESNISGSKESTSQETCIGDSAIQSSKILIT